MWFMLLLMGGQLLELLVYYHRPELLAPLAVLPIGARRAVPLPSEAEEALTTLESGAASYRTSARRSLDLSRMRLRGSVDVGDTTLLFSGRPARVLARRHWDMQRKVRSLVRVDMTAGERHIVLRPRYYPIGTLSVLAAVVGMSLQMRAPATMVLALLAVPVLALFSMLAASRHVDTVAEEVSRRVRELAPPPPVIRTVTRSRVEQPAFRLHPPPVRVEVDDDDANAMDAPPSEPGRARR